MATIEADFLFDLSMRVVPGAEPIGRIAQGTRIVAYVKGKFDGPQLKGSVENGADWFMLRPDGIGDIDVRLTLKTDGGELIYMHYTGFCDIPKAVADATPVGQLPAGTFPLRTAIRFETASAKHTRLNHTQAVGIGVLDSVAGTVNYKIYAL